MGALISFLGGSAFRMIWGEVSSWLTARQQHSQQLDMMKLQETIDEANHKRSLESQQLQSSLGIKQIQVQAQGAADQTLLDAWKQAVTDVGKTTGVKFIDIWNGSIRPFLATAAALVVIIEAAKNGFDLSEWDRELVGAILGVYVADRSLTNRGK